MSDVTNPPAFPTQDSADGGGFQCGELLWQYPGMSLRDWFAGQALDAVIRTCASDTDARKLGPEPYFAIKAYAIADAMLAERVKVKL